MICDIIIDFVFTARVIEIFVGDTVGNTGDTIVCLQWRDFAYALQVCSSIFLPAARTIMPTCSRYGGTASIRHHGEEPMGLQRDRGGNLGRKLLLGTSKGWHLIEQSWAIRTTQVQPLSDPRERICHDSMTEDCRCVVKGDVGCRKKHNSMSLTRRLRICLAGMQRHTLPAARTVMVTCIRYGGFASRRHRGKKPTGLQRDLGENLDVSLYRARKNSGRLIE